MKKSEKKNCVVLVGPKEDDLTKKVERLAINVFDTVVTVEHRNGMYCTSFYRGETNYNKLCFSLGGVRKKINNLGTEQTLYLFGAKQGFDRNPWESNLLNKVRNYPWLIYNRRSIDFVYFFEFNPEYGNENSFKTYINREAAIEHIGTAIDKKRKSDPLNNKSASGTLLPSNKDLNSSTVCPDGQIVICFPKKNNWFLFSTKSLLRLKIFQHLLVCMLSRSQNVTVLIHPQANLSKLEKKFYNYVNVRIYKSLYSPQFYKELSNYKCAICIGTAAVVDFLYHGLPVIELGKKPRVRNFEYNYKFLKFNIINIFKLKQFLRQDWKEKTPNLSLPDFLPGYLQSKECFISQTEGEIKPQKLLEHKNVIKKEEAESIIANCRSYLMKGVK